MNQVLDLSYWVDGLGHRVRIRPAAIPELNHYLSDLSIRARSPHVSLLELLMKIVDFYNATGITIGKYAVVSTLTVKDGELWSRLQRAFIDVNMSCQTRLPIVVFSNPKPENATSFLFHVLLSMGRFGNELQLVCQPTICDCFVYANLIEVHNLSQSVDNLLKRYILEQLVYYPISTRTFDKYCVRAERVLHEALINNNLPMCEIPPVLFTNLQKQSSEKFKAYIAETQDKIVEAAYGEICEHVQGDDEFPSENCLKEAGQDNYLSWSGDILRTEVQSLESYVEQCDVRATVKIAIDKYRLPESNTTKGVLIAGGPGNGKSFCLCHAVLYARSKGLVCAMTAVLADRARLLGGVHFHKLFCLAARNGLTPHRMAELAIIQLQRKPQMLTFLLSLDVLFADELGQLSAELLSVLDMILRRIRESTLFMGGVLLIGTLDQHQLKPIHGKPFLTSPHLLTSFQCKVLTRSVRSGNDLHLQRLNCICRMSSEQIAGYEKEFIDLIDKHCAFVETWHDPLITDHVFRVFPTHAPAQQALAEYLAKVKSAYSNFPDSIRSVKSQDSEIAVQSHGEWKTASAATSKRLNMKVSEPDCILFYPKALFHFTFNCPGRFCHTQLGLVWNIPDQSCLDNFEPIDIYVAPAGSRIVDFEINEENDLLSRGWRLEKLTTAPMYEKIIGNTGLKARRRQYGIKHHIVSTIHACIGLTVGKLSS